MRISDWSSDVCSSDLPTPDARWSSSGWVVLRGDGAAGAAFGGSQLGGSQAGARLAYAIDPAHRLQLVGRVATPLRGRGREAAIGVAWQPTRAPVRVVAEQRFAIDGGRGGPAIEIGRASCRERVCQYV